MTLAPTRLDAPRVEIDAVIAAALDYIDGYTRADPERHARAYHPECVKRRYAVDPDTGVTELVDIPPRTMVDHAAVIQPIEDCEREVVIDAISEGIASVRIYSCRWVDFAHVVKARGEWKLFHVTWHARTES